jgi:hypothetical protein
MSGDIGRGWVSNSKGKSDHTHAPAAPARPPGAGGRACEQPAPAALVGPPALPRPGRGAAGSLGRRKGRRMGGGGVRGLGRRITGVEGVGGSPRPGLARLLQPRCGAAQSGQAVLEHTAHRVEGAEDKRFYRPVRRWPTPLRLPGPVPGLAVGVHGRWPRHPRLAVASATAAASCSAVAARARGQARSSATRPPAAPYGPTRPAMSLSAHGTEHGHACAGSKPIASRLSASAATACGLCATSSTSAAGRARSGSAPADPPWPARCARPGH